MRECRSIRGQPETAERETEASPLLERLYQFIDVVVEGLEIVIESGLAADRWIEHHHFRARFLGDRLRRFAVEVWLHHDRFDAFSLDQLDEIERVRWRRRNARFRFDGVDDVESEVLRKV